MSIVYLIFLLTCSPSAVLDGSNLVIDGKGEVSNSIFISISKSLVKIVTINEGITSIASNTFEKFESMETIYLPDSLETIGANAFRYTKLSTLHIPCNVKEISSIPYLFYCSYYLQSITVNESNPKYSSFNDCLYTRDLTKLLCCPTMKNSITFSSVITTVGTWAFYKSQIQSITFADSITTFEEMLLVDAITVEIKFTSQSLLSNLPSNCFWTSFFTDFLCPPMVASIGFRSFYTTQIKTFRVMENSILSTLGDKCFYNCKQLQSVELPATIQTIESTSFDGCTSLSSIEIKGESDHYSTVGGAIFTNDLSQLVFVPPKISEFVIPANTSLIGGSALQQCMYLTNLTVHKDNLNFKAYQNIIYDIEMTTAKFSAGSIVNATIYRGAKILDTTLFTGHPLLEYVKYEEGSVLEKIESGCFSLTKNLVFIDFPDTVTTIASGAFRESSIKRVVFAKNVEILQSNLFELSLLEYFECPEDSVLSKIAPRSFYRTTNIKSVAFSSKVSSIQEDVFKESSIESIKLPNALSSMGNNVFMNCAQLSEVEIDKDAPLTEIPSYTFQGCVNLKRVTLSKNVETIFEGCFKDCRNLESLVLTGKDNLKYIKQSAFSGCNFTSFTIPDSLIEVTPDVFYYCNNLNTFLTSSNLRFKAVDNILYNDKETVLEIFPPGLEVATVKKSVLQIADGAFAYSQKLKSLDFEEPSSITELPSKMLMQCTSLTSIRIASSVSLIDVSVFEGCTNLASFAVSNNSALEDLQSQTFKDCDLLSEVIFEGECQMYSISDGLFENKVALKTAKMPPNLLTIKSSAFADCVSLEGFEFGEFLIEIEDSAFRNCKKLGNISLGFSITSIGACAFDGCSGALSLEIPAALDPESVGDLAFGRMKSLIEVFYCGSSHFDQANVLTEQGSDLKVTTLIGYPFRQVFGIDCTKVMDKCHIYPTVAFSPFISNQKSILGLVSSVVLNDTEDI